MTINFISNPLNELENFKKQIGTKEYIFFEEELSEKEFVNFGNRLGTVYSHRDSSSNGIIVVKSVYHAPEAELGYFGMTNSHLFPHTDR